MRDPMQIVWEKILKNQPGSFRARRFATATYAFLLGVLVGFVGDCYPVVWMFSRLPF